MSILVCNHLDREERAGYFAWFVLLVSRDCCVALPRGAMSLSAVCDCGISKSYCYKAVHFINTLARKGKCFVIEHLAVCMLVYSAVSENSCRKS